MSNGGPRDGQGCKVRAILEGVKDHAIRLGCVEAVEPHALNLRSQFWKVIEVPHSLLQRSKGVAVNSGAGGTVDELLQGVA